MFLNKDWDKIDKAARIRISNMLILALNNFEFKWETNINDYGNYVNNEFLDEDGDFCQYLQYLPHKYSDELPFINIKPIIDKKMRLSNSYSTFILDNLGFLFIENEESVYPAFEGLFIEFLEAKDASVFSFLMGDDHEPAYNLSQRLQSAIDGYISEESVI